MDENSLRPTINAKRSRGRPRKIVTPSVDGEHQDRTEQQPANSKETVVDKPKSPEQIWKDGVEINSHLPPPPLEISIPNGWIPIQVEDVVQVVNNESKYFGMLFIVGDIKEHRVHGYYLLTGGKHEYMTVGEDEVMLVGKKMKGHIRSKSACSPKWIADGK